LLQALAASEIESKADEKDERPKKGVEDRDPKDSTGRRNRENKQVAQS